MSIHILVLGQSNVASHGTGRHRSASHGRVWHEGALLPLRDPVKGGSGQGSSIWTYFVEALEARGIGEDVVISMRARGGTSSKDWGAGGVLFESLVEDIPGIKACPVPLTHVVFHQGERDVHLQTDANQYSTRISSLIEMVNGVWPTVPWVFCRASYRKGITSARIIEAQNSLIARYRFCRPGPNTDTLGSDYRRDDLHFNPLGLRAFADALADKFGDLEREAPQ